MRTITVTSLSGGQGKTTTAFMLAKLLAKHNNRVLVVDADPQANLTLYFGHQVEDDQPTLLELLTGEISPQDAAYPVGDNLHLIPADNGLDNALQYLNDSGMGAVVLRNRLEQLYDQFDACVIDSPPARTQISLTAIGAASDLVIPVETGTKGCGSLCRTLELVDKLTELRAFTGSTLGVVPFRDRWFGNNRAKESASSIQFFEELLEERGQGTLFSPIAESERFKQALTSGCLVSEVGDPHLEKPFQELVDALALKTPLRALTANV